MVHLQEIPALKEEEHGLIIIGVIVKMIVNDVEKNMTIEIDVEIQVGVVKERKKMTPDNLRQVVVEVLLMIMAHWLNDQNGILMINRAAHPPVVTLKRSNFSYYCLYHNSYYL